MEIINLGYWKVAVRTTSNIPIVNVPVKRQKLHRPTVPVAKDRNAIKANVADKFNAVKKYR